MLTQQNMLCTQKQTAVYTVFLQQIEFNLGMQTFNQQTLYQHNILPLHTVFTQTTGMSHIPGCYGNYSETSISSLS